MKNINKILLITLTNIGDAVLTLPVALVLREKFPSARLDVLLGPRPQQLFKKISYFHQAIVYDKRVILREKIKLVLKLKKEKYDLIVDLRHSLFPLFIGARYRTPLLFRIPEQIRHIRDFHLRKLKLSGVEFTNFSSDNPFGVSSDEKEKIDELLADKGIYPEDKLIVLAPGANDKVKRWKAENFAWLSDKLTEQKKVILVGSKEDSKSIDKIVSLSVNMPLRLDGQLGLKDLAVLLKRCALFIGNDSAPMHISSLLGIPVVGIFGPTDVERSKPLSKKSRAIKNGSSIDSVKPEEVLEAAKELLKDEQ